MDIRPSAAPSSPMDADGANRRDRSAVVLVVERDPHVQELLEHFLTGAGHTVHFAMDGCVALERSRALRPDVVITEILVPRLDGLQLCTRLKADETTRDACVIVFSLLAARERVREAGADAFVMKPLSEERLLRVVDDLLDERARRSLEEGA